MGTFYVNRKIEELDTQRRIAGCQAGAQRGEGFGNRFDSAKSLSARVTHRGSHLPGVTLK